MADPLTSIRAELERVKALADQAEPNPHLTRYDNGGGRSWTGGLADLGRTLVADYYNEGDREFYHDARTSLPRMARALEKALWFLEEGNSTGWAPSPHSMASRADETVAAIHRLLTMEDEQ